MRRDIPPGLASSPGYVALAEMGFDPALFVDPWWRLCNLYTIVNDDSKEIPFRPNAVQQAFYRNLWHRMIILKSRQHGYTTFIDLLALDQCLFVPNFDASIIADTLENVGKIFDRKISRVYHALHPALREAVPLVSESKTGLKLSNGSYVDVALTTRGGTKQLLHVSEMGKIAAQDPAKAREIVTGGFESVPQSGFLFVESTAKGLGGEFHDLVKAAQRVRDSGRKLLPLDFRLVFVPWWRKAENVVEQHQGVPITSKQREYFASVEAKTGVQLSPAQCAWYALKEETLGDDMFSEHPSTEEEPFFVSDEGKYYAKQITLLRRRGQIGRFPWVEAVPVNTFWDIAHGGQDYVAIWFHQRIQGMDRFIYYYEISGEAWAHYKRVMDDTGFIFGRHYLPHDAARAVPGIDENDVIEQQINRAGIRPTFIVPRIESILVGIQLVRDVLPNCCFDAEDCALGIERLAGYSKEWNETLARWRETPRKDANAHGADGFRQFAQSQQDLKSLGFTQVKPVRERQNALSGSTRKRRSWRAA